ncbi:cytidine deaminase [Halodesulfovibrio spirochaetisodalis]|uniref:ABC transporter substrate-binding protein n=1 Tax=Halodesulfovibrio spirochaetisodalis TaxID=1560234 RepID=A0A1B7XFI2_9BACT|nr:cytidine deaminase [Halodesulfovibrio spirochaetisodalis]OBQ54033.1 ABC transporter substrate-binding protein [Halodesulfovibrio spirochaetisodalis]
MRCRFLAVFMGIALSVCSFVVVPHAYAEAPIKVVYGFDREFPPFSFEEAKGKAVGFDVDLIRAIFKGQNVKLVTRPLVWDHVLMELSSGAIDLSTGMAKTKQRSLLFNFSEKPTLPMKVRLFTKATNRVGNITLLRGQSVSVKRGSFQQRVLEEFGGMNVKAFPSKVDAIHALGRDQVQAYCGPEQTAYYYLKRFRYGKISPVGSLLRITDSYIAVNRDKGRILEMVNKGFQRVVATGEYDRIYRKWFVPELQEDELSNLFDEASKAAVNAYAPYTKSPVGAAVLTRSGKMYVGCNVETAKENISAIKTAVLKAIADGEYDFRAVAALAADGSVVAPTAEDRQFLFEFGRGILAAVEPDKGDVKMIMVSQLLPYPILSGNKGFTYE